MLSPINILIIYFPDRVSIALQLLMDPHVLLLDEPTSGLIMWRKKVDRIPLTFGMAGLDSTTAFHIMENLHALAKRGRTVIATIHQPASEIFNLVDRVLLLSRGSLMI